MGKKTMLLTLLLTLMLLVVSSISAFAAPSRTVPDFNRVDDEYEFEFDDEDIPYSNFSFNIVRDENEVIDPEKKAKYDAIQAELEKILEFLEGDEPIIEYFLAAFREALTELLPDDFDLNTLELTDYQADYVLGYMKEMGDVKIMVSFPTEYELGQTIVAFAGLMDVKNAGDDEEELEYDTEWYLFEAEVVLNNDGERMVQITFTEEFFTIAMENPFALGILRQIEE